MFVFQENCRKYNRQQLISWYNNFFWKIVTKSLDVSGLFQIFCHTKDELPTILFEDEISQLTNQSLYAAFSKVAYECIDRETVWNSPTSKLYTTSSNIL